MKTYSPPDSFLLPPNSRLPSPDSLLPTPDFPPDSLLPTPDSPLSSLPTSNFVLTLIIHSLFVVRGLRTTNKN